MQRNIPDPDDLIQRQLYKIEFMIMNTDECEVKLFEYLYPENETLLKSKGYNIKYQSWYFDKNWYPNGLYIQNHVIISWQKEQKEKYNIEDIIRDLKIYKSVLYQFSNYWDIPKIILQDLEKKGYHIMIDVHLYKNAIFWQGTINQYIKENMDHVLQVCINDQDRYGNSPNFLLKILVIINESQEKNCLQ